MHFVSFPLDIVNSRLISRQHSAAYDEFMEYMDCLQTRNLCHLLDPNLKNGKYQTMEDIEISIIMFPGAYIDLNGSLICPIRSLRRFHEHSKRNIVRGLDSSSKHAFLSVALRSDTNNERTLLLLCTFDPFGMSDSRLYEWRETIREYDGPKIGDLHDLLAEEYKAFSNVDGVWTMESTLKRRSRRIKECILSVGCIGCVVFSCWLGITVLLEWYIEISYHSVL